LVKIGVFDSGIGGLSILREIIRQLPGGEIIYLADNHNHPYGPRSIDNIYEISHGIVSKFNEQGVKHIVVACNTASGAALHRLRENFPHMKFIGMEPAVKPAAERSISRKVAVLATTATLSALPYAGVVERFAEGVEIYELPCNGLAEAIEKGEGHKVIEPMLRDWLEPVIEAGVDQIALACTHYPLEYELICSIAGEGAAVIDPAPAVVRQLIRVIALDGNYNDNKLKIRLYSSAAPAALKEASAKYLGKSYRVASWDSY